MSPLSGGIGLDLKTQHVLALRKALALAVLCDDERDPPRLTYADRRWISEVERSLWPARIR